MLRRKKSFAPVRTFRAYANPNEAPELFPLSTEPAKSVPWAHALQDALNIAVAHYRAPAPAFVRPDLNRATHSNQLWLDGRPHLMVLALIVTTLPQTVICGLVCSFHLLASSWLSARIFLWALISLQSRNFSATELSLTHQSEADRIEDVKPVLSPPGKIGQVPSQDGIRFNHGLCKRLFRLPVSAEECLHGGRRVAANRETLPFSPCLDCAAQRIPWRQAREAPAVLPCARTQSATEFRAPLLAFSSVFGSASSSRDVSAQLARGIGVQIDFSPCMTENSSA